MQQLKVLPAAGGAPVAEHRNRLTDPAGAASRQLPRRIRAIPSFPARPTGQTRDALIPKMAHAGAAAITMIKRTQETSVSARHRETGRRYPYFRRQPFGDAALQRQADNGASNMLGAKFIQPRLQCRVITVPAWRWRPPAPAHRRRFTAAAICDGACKLTTP